MAIIEDLERTKQEILGHFSLPPVRMARRESSGKWSVRQLLHHLTDAESVLYDRIKRTISEQRPFVFAFDQEAWAEKLDYETMPVELSRNTFESLRNGLIYLAQKHYDKDGMREFVHSEMGVRTLKQEFEKVVEHSENHLRQIRRILEREEASS